MSECVKEKKLHIRCSSACSSCQLLDQRKNTNEATVAEELKRERDYSSGYYCAMFYLLNA